MVKITKSLAIENNGDKKSQQNSPVGANQDRVLEHKLSFTCFVPDNFDIDALLIENPPSFKYHKDKFNYITHLITEIPSKRKRNEDGESFWEKIDYQYTCIYTPLLQAKIHNYKDYLKYLINNGVLISDNQYFKGQKSKGYMFSRKYQTDIKPIPLTKQVFIRRVLEFVKVDYSSLGNKLINEQKNQPKYKYLNKWFNDKLTIDFVSAISYLNDLYNKEKQLIGHLKAMRRKNQRRIVVEKIHRGLFINTVDRTAGRLHTALTQLKSELRQFVRYDGKKLVAVDLKNSQPYLSTILFDHDQLIKREILKVIKEYNFNYNTEYNPHNIPYYVSKNIELYKNLVESGKLYERFVVALIKEGLLDSNEDFNLLRSKAKKAVLISLFSPNSAISYNKEMQLFKRIFPDVYDVFKSIKYGKGKHNTLAILLQKIETELILDEACRILTDANPVIPIFTLHDAIITTEEHIDFVELVMKEVLTDAIGLTPTVKREYWTA